MTNTNHTDLPGQLYLFGPPSFFFPEEQLQEVRQWGVDGISEKTRREILGERTFDYIVDEFACPHEKSAFHPDDWGCPEENCRCGHE